jgi:AcrR family transcriptional regulator
VNRGLIHHYFGSRRSLLRSALDLGIKRSVPEALRRRVLDPEEKGTRQFRDYVRDHAEYPRLVALLALDGDETLEPLLFADDRLEDYERERGAGQFADDVDFAALLTTWDATLIGYSLIREAASRQLGIPPRRLDRRILAMLARQMQALRSKND